MTDVSKIPSDEEELREHQHYIQIAFWVAIVFSVATVIVYLLTFHSGLSSDQSDWGTFGDYVGGLLNPVVALVALWALLKTISLQIKELHVVKAELKKTISIAEQQNATAERQSFEHTFFQMIRLHHTIADRIQLDADEWGADGFALDKFRGRTAFRTLCERLDDHVGQTDPEPTLEDEREAVVAAWNLFFVSRYPVITHYLRNFYALLKFVKDRAPADDLQQYVRILQAQISVHELKLLFYNALQPTTNDFKQLIEQTGFLSAARIMVFAVETHGEIEPNHYKLYDIAAYGDFDPEQLWNVRT